MAGRGGAGNILEAANKKVDADLEASRALAEDGIETSPIAKALRNEQNESSVAMSGRGGAGNAYNPSDLTKKGKFQSDEAGIAIKESEQATSQMQGRGGAGNFVPAPASGGGKQGAEPLTGKIGLEAINRQVTEDVEKGLARPDPVHLGPKAKEGKVPSIGS